MILDGDGDCFICGEEGHWVEHCPLKIPAASRAEHEGRIALFVERWIDGKITAHQKRRLIEAENELHKPRTGAKAK